MPTICNHCKINSSLKLSGIRHNSYPMVEQSSYITRCTNCNKKSYYSLPKLNKKVIYLDQFIICNMINVTNGNYVGSESAFLKKLAGLIRRVYLKQAAIFPSSIFHMEEALLWRNYDIFEQEKYCYFGDASFKDPLAVLLHQLKESIGAWVKNSTFEPSFNVDKILDITHLGNPRKAWSDISSIKLVPKMEFKFLEPDIRSSKSTNSNYISDMFKQYQFCNKLERKKFKKHVNNSLNTFAAEYLRFYSMLHDFEKFPFDSWVRIVLINIDQIMGDIQVIDSEISKSTITFIQSEYFKKIPIYNIKACLLSALAREAANGRKVPPSRGTANDISFISTYMPYCDGMFVDKEWGILLNQNPLKEMFKDYKAQIFSMGNKEKFINYLEELENKVPTDILENARLLYKVE